MELKEIRKAIDEIDAKIFVLLNMRMEHAVMARKFKEKIQDESREKQIYNRLKKQKSDLLNPEFCKNLFKEILDESKRLQNKKLDLIGFKGAHGTYSEGAIKSWNKYLISIPNNSLSDIFEGVESGKYDYGIIPAQEPVERIHGIENTRFSAKDFKTVVALKHPVKYCLLSLAKTDQKNIKKVYSHPEILVHCKEFLEGNNFEALPYSDAAGAAKMLSERKLECAAVIASEAAATIYNLEILKRNIGGPKDIKSSFIVISKHELMT